MPIRSELRSRRGISLLEAVVAVAIVGMTAVGALEFRSCRVGQHGDCGLGDPGQCSRDRQGIGCAVDKLHAKGEAKFAHPPPHPVENALVVVIRLACAELRDKFRHFARKVEGTGIDQRVEQVRAPRQLSGERRGKAEPVGDVLDVSRGLARHAPPDVVLASGEVYRLARRAFAFGDEEMQVTIDTQGGSKTRLTFTWPTPGTDDTAFSTQPGMSPATGHPGAVRVMSTSTLRSPSTSRR